MQTDTGNEQNPLPDSVTLPPLDYSADSSVFAAGRPEVSSAAPERRALPGLALDLQRAVHPSGQSPRVREA